MHPQDQSHPNPDFGTSSLSTLLHVTPLPSTETGPQWFTGQTLEPKSLGSNINSTNFCFVLNKLFLFPVSQLAEL
jgi:hypothetical protein